MVVDQAVCEERDRLIVGYLNSQGELSKLVGAVGEFGWVDESGEEIENAEEVVAIRLRALVDHCREHGC